MGEGNKLAKEQERMREQLRLTDDTLSFDPETLEGLDRVGGMDVSFDSNSEVAYAGLAVLSYPTFHVVHTEVQPTALDMPYLPGYLGFREAPPCANLLNRLSEGVQPQVLIVDGNGTLHPRRFGLACHIGVLAGVPTVGVAKNLLRVDGISREVANERAAERLKGKGEWEELRGDCDELLGAMVLPTSSTTRPSYVSPGHRISLRTAVRVATRCMRFRAPEPIRVADRITRAKLAT